MFDFLADRSDNPRAATRRYRDHPAAGSVDLGFSVSADYRIAAFDRFRLLAITVTSGGPIRPTLAHGLTPAGNGSTAVRCTVEFHPGGLGRLATPALALLHPVFSWEASSIERGRRLLEQR